MISANLVFENKNFIDEYEFFLVRVMNDILIFAEESITAGKQKFELCNGQKESYLLTDKASHASERAVGKILSSYKKFMNCY